MGFHLVIVGEGRDDGEIDLAIGLELYPEFDVHDEGHRELLSAEIEKYLQRWYGRG